MLVFVTGAAGYIGRAVVQELLSNGHTVLGLARSDANSEAIAAAGAQVHRGDLEDLESLKSGAKAADGVIHLAFVHDFNDFPRVAGIDTAAVEAMGEVLVGTGKPLVIASGTLSLDLEKGVVATEDTDNQRNTPFSGRALTSDAVYRLSKNNGVRGSVVRLAPTVHGKEDKAFLPMLDGMGKKAGVVTYIGNGSARWPAVHRLDSAVLFRLALEKGTPGATYHAVADQGVAMKDIMGVMGKKLKLPVEGKSVAEATSALGFFAHLIGTDNPVSSERTQKELGWKPTQIGLLQDMEENYFI